MCKVPDYIDPICHPMIAWKGMIFLETERLLLRNIQEKDLDILYDYRNNQLCSRHQRSQTKDREGLIKLIAERKNGKISVEEAFILVIALSFKRE